MGPLEAALSDYEPADGTETADVARIRALIAGGDPWDRHQALHVTASAVVVDADSRVLLRWHERMRRWLHVGGHGDPGERDPWHVAGREAAEETGLKDLTALAPVWEARPVQVVIVGVPASAREPAHEHGDIRYVLATTRPDDIVAESPRAALRWMALADALGQVEEENLRVCLRRIHTLLAT